MTPWRAVTAAVVVALVAATAIVLWPQRDVVRISAEFPRTVGLYVGSQVRVLGVPIGTVDSITPAGTSVRVEMSYDAGYRVPAKARAVIISPSVVADRFVQLSPGYSGGQVLRDGDEIPPQRTAVPVELDQIFRASHGLTEALGPQGANESGSLSRLLDVSAENMAGQGERFHRTIENFSRAMSTFSRGREDFFGGIRHIQRFTTELAENDAQVRRFTTDLAAVSSQLAGEREELAGAVDSLAVALGEVRTFVRDNKAGISHSVRGLREVSGVLARQQDALREILEVAPVGLGSLSIAGDVASGAVGSRSVMDPAMQDPDGYVCAILRNSDAPDPEGTCRLLSTLAGWLPPRQQQATAPDPTLGGILDGGA